MIDGDASTRRSASGGGCYMIPECGFVHAARFASAATLIGGIRRDRDVAVFREMLGIQTRDLFLNPAIRVRYDDRRIFSARIVVCRSIDIGGNIQTIQFVFDMCYCPCRLALRDCATID